MGINIGICETDCADAPCRELKLKVLRVKVPTDSPLAAYGEHDTKVSLADAGKATGDLEALIKRNRLSAETDAIYIDKIKKEEDLAALKPYAVTVPTGWVSLEKLTAAQREEAEKISDRDDWVTAWDEVSFDDMNAMCAACKLSWDKGRGCVGAFGPDNSQLPAIAAKAGCPLTAAVPELAQKAQRLTPADAAALLKEVAVLRPALVADGKMAVRRYSGPLDRMEAVAQLSVAENCNFYFF